jgi:hypothetical protein
MMPDPKKAELSYLYFNPKTHKVVQKSVVIIILNFYLILLK